MKANVFVWMGVWILAAGCHGSAAPPELLWEIGKQDMGPDPNKAWGARAEDAPPKP